MKRATLSTRTYQPVKTVIVVLYACCAGATIDNRKADYDTAFNLAMVGKWCETRKDGSMVYECEVK